MSMVRLGRAVIGVCVTIKNSVNDVGVTRKNVRHTSMVG